MGAGCGVQRWWGCTSVHHIYTVCDLVCGTEVVRLLIDRRSDWNVDLYATAYTWTGERYEYLVSGKHSMSLQYVTYITIEVSSI